MTSAPAITSPTVDTLASIQETHPDPPRIHDSDDDNTTQATQTEEDLPAEALRETVDKLHDEGDEDEIVFNPRSVFTPYESECLLTYTQYGFDAVARIGSKGNSANQLTTSRI